MCTGVDTMGVATMAGCVAVALVAGVGNEAAVVFVARFGMVAVFFWGIEVAAMLFGMATVAVGGAALFIAGVGAVGALVARVGIAAVFVVGVGRAAVLIAGVETMAEITISIKRCS